MMERESSGETGPRRDEFLEIGGTGGRSLAAVAVVALDLSARPRKGARRRGPRLLLLWWSLV